MCWYRASDDNTTLPQIIGVRRTYEERFQCFFNLKGLIHNIPYYRPQIGRVKLIYMFASPNLAQVNLQIGPLFYFTLNIRGRLCIDSQQETICKMA